MTDGLKILVSGRVQGVGFRAFVRAEARRRGVTGYARNLADGRVEVALHGDADAVEQVRRAVAEGPPPAQVTDLQSEPATAPAPGDFTIG